MVKQIKWLDRKFDFNYHTGMMPVFLARLEGSIARLESLAAGKSEEELSEKKDGSWSVKEHIGHLTDLEALHEARLDEILAGKKQLSAADMSNKKTNDASHNKRDAAELINYFRETRLRFIKRLEELGEDQVIRAGLHPRLDKQMRIVDIAFFTAEHDDHHIAIIRSILNQNK